MVAATLWSVLVLAVALEASACPICFGFPKQTDADKVVGGWCVLAARPQSQDPFQYAAQAVLKGAYDGSNFDLLVDSATRRLLDAHPDHSVLLVQETAGGPWQNLGPISPEFAAVVRRLVKVGEGWTGADAVAQRWQFFLPLFGHADERIRTLAYLELGRAPYSVIRQLGRHVPRDALEPFLGNRQYIEWQGLAILLLAQSESARDRQWILNSFQASIQFGLVMNLSAQAAAAIEIDPLTSMELIESNYFTCADRSTAELEAVLRAVSMHGELDDLSLRERIIASYGLLLRHRPQFAPQVANDLFSWKRTELVERLVAISQQPHDFDFDQILTIQRYVRGVASAEAIGRVDD
jgi:hypothetical protein